MEKSMKAIKDLMAPIKLSMSEKKHSGEDISGKEDAFYNPGLYNLEEEYKKYSQMIQSGIEDKDIFFRIGRINHFWSNFDIAKIYYQKALLIDPENGEVHYNLGNIYFKDGNFSEAKKEFSIAISRNSGDVYALNALGKTCFKLKEFKEAEECHKGALINNPDDGHALRGLGDIYIIQKNYKEAFDYYYRALDVNPNDKMALHNIGIGHILSGNWQKAEKHYKTCIQNHKNFPGFYFGIALCYYKGARKQEAIEMYKGGLNLIKDQPDYISLAMYEDIKEQEIEKIKDCIFSEVYAEEDFEKIRTEAEKAKGTGKKKPESISTLLSVDPISIELGRELLAFIDPNQGGKLLEKLKSVRRHLAIELGIIIPGFRFRDNFQLKPNEYNIKIKELKIARGEVFKDKLLIVAPEKILHMFTGQKSFDPAYKMPAMWINSEDKVKAEELSCMIFDSISVITVHIMEILRNSSAELLSRQEVSTLLEIAKKNYPAVVKEIYPDLFNLGEIQKILQNLLKERIPVRDIGTILETIGDYGHITRDPDILSEYVRRKFSRIICKEYENKDGIIKAIILDTELEKIFARSLEKNEFEISINIPEKIKEPFFKEIDKKVKHLIENGIQPLLLCPSSIRLYLKRLTMNSIPLLAVLSYDEVKDYNVEKIEKIKINIKEKNRKVIGERNIFLYIDKLKKDKEPEVRMEAVKILLSLADENNLDVIFDYLDIFLEDKEPAVRLEASVALRELVVAHREMGDSCNCSDECCSH